PIVPVLHGQVEIGDDARAPPLRDEPVADVRGVEVHGTDPGHARLAERQEQVADIAAAGQVAPVRQRVLRDQDRLLHTARGKRLDSSRIVFTDSSRARSMKAHVLTMRHSASSGSVVRGNPASVSMPSISSESTWFLGQPRVVRWTFMSEAQYTLAHRRGPRRPP